jgi:hypothetical protein
VTITTGRGGRVLSVVADVKGDDLEPLAERAPERVIAVDGEAVAVRDDEADAGVQAPVTADADDGAVTHDGVEGLVRSGNSNVHAAARRRAVGRRDQIDQRR